MTNRGGKGVKTLQVTEKTGELVGIKSVIDGDDLMIITKKGTTIRIPVDGLRVMGRATQGVKVIRLDDEDEIASIAKVEEHLLKTPLMEGEMDVTGEGSIDEVNHSSESNPENLTDNSTENNTENPTDNTPENPTGEAPDQTNE